MVSGLSARLQNTEKHSNAAKLRGGEMKKIDVNRHYGRKRERERGKQWNNKNVNERYKKTQVIGRINEIEEEWVVQSAKEVGCKTTSGLFAIKLKGLGRYWDQYFSLTLLDSECSGWCFMKAGGGGNEGNTRARKTRRKEVMWGK